MPVMCLQRIGPNSGSFSVVMGERAAVSWRCTRDGVLETDVLAAVGTIDALAVEVDRSFFVQSAKLGAQTSPQSRPTRTAQNSSHTVVQHRGSDAQT